MSITRNSISGREFNKFVESPTRPGEPAIEVVGSFASATGPFEAPPTTDTVLRTVLVNVEIFEYKAGGVFGTTLKTVTVTYTDATLNDLSYVVVS